MQAMTEPLMAGLLSKQFMGKEHHSSVHIKQDAYWRLPPKLRAMVDAAIRDACRRKNCNRRDLVWSINLTRKECPVIHVRKREQIVL